MRQAPILLRPCGPPECCLHLCPSRSGPCHTDPGYVVVAPPWSPKGVRIVSLPPAFQPAGALETAQDRVERARLEVRLSSNLNPGEFAAGGIHQCGKHLERLGGHAGFIGYHDGKST